MGLNTNERQDVIYFIGTEVENTPMKGEQTLFVVGVQPPHEIQKRAEEHDIKHLYFGTSQSFTIDNEEDFTAWQNMIKAMLTANYWCTLDFGVEYAKDVLAMGFDEHDKYISMISVKLPYIKKFNYNATLKIDDTTWGHSNPGVWCHSLHELQKRRVYTDWSEYVGDTTIK
tara:strand:+ start:887 stop:1399 length:513 start_codon:yes stop_codon:yes gene_type:complete